MKSFIHRLFVLLFVAVALVSCGEQNALIPTDGTTGTGGNVSASTATYGALNLTSGLAAGQMVADSSAGQVLLRAEVLDITGAAIVGAPVKFFTSLGSLSASSAVTDARGIAEVGFYVYDASNKIKTGTANITASAGGFLSPLSITLLPGAPAKVTSSAVPASVSPGGVLNLFAHVIDSNGNPVPNETISFSIVSNASGNAFIQLPTAVTNANGDASVVYTAGAKANTTGSVIDTVRASALSNGIVNTDANNNISDTRITVTNADVVVAQMRATAGDVSMVADDVSSTSIIAEITDGKNDPITGYEVKFQLSNTDLAEFLDRPAVNGGQVVPGSIIYARTNASGVAEVTLKSKSQAVGVAVVSATAGGQTKDVSVSITAGPPLLSKMNTIAAPSTIRPTGTVTLTTQIYDSNNLPVANESVIYTITKNCSGGNLPVATAITNVNGEAKISYVAGINLNNTDPTCANNTDIITTKALSNGSSLTTSIVVSSDAVIVGEVIATAGTQAIPADGVSRVAVNALVLDRNQAPVPGKPVNFTTTLGQLIDALGNPATSDVTDNDGIATLYLLSANAAGAPALTGVARVSTESSGFFSSVNVQFQAGDVANVQLSASPTLIGAQQLVQLTALVTDINGSPVNGEQVNFSVPVNASLGQLLQLSATTNINGNASVSYQTGTVAGGSVDTLRATAVSNATFGERDITVDSLATAVSAVNVTTGATQLVADGVSSVFIRAEVLDVASNPVAGQVVNFSSSFGPLSAPTAVTNSAGIAEVNLTSTTQVGLSNIIASVNGFNSTASVEFIAGSPTTLVLASNVATVSLNGTTTLTATLTDVNGNRVPSERVIFEIRTNNSGSTLSAVDALTNLNGQASVQFTAGSVVDALTNTSVDTLAARAASSATATSSTTLTVQASGVVVGSVVISTGASTIKANGTSVALIRAEVMDTAGNPVANFNVDFSTSLGIFSNMSGVPASALVSVATDSNGIAQALLTTLKADKVTVENTGVASVIVNANGFSNSVPVNFVADAPSVVLVDPPSINLAPNTATQLTATVVDQYQHVVSGELVRFNIAQGLGTLSALSATTDVNGRATVSYNTGTMQADGDVVWVDAIASSSGISGRSVVTVAANAVRVGSIELISGSPFITADGTAKTVMRARVLDATGAAIPGVQVALATTLGSIRDAAGVLLTAATMPVTDTLGTVEVYLSSMDNAGVVSPTGVATIGAFAGGFSKTLDVSLVAGPPDFASITMNAAPATVQPGGSTFLTTTVADANGNPVVGETLSFAAQPNSSGGVFVSSTAVTNGSGVAVVEYSVGTTLGTDTLQVTTSSNGVKKSLAVVVSSGAVSVNAVTLDVGSPSVVVDQSTAGSAGSTLLRATVLDVAGNPVTGIPVSFKTTLGTLYDANLNTPLAAGATVTTVNGIAEVLLRTFNTVTGLVETIGTARVSASANGFTGFNSVSFVAAAPLSVSVVSAPNPASPQTEVAITAQVHDQYLNPVVGELVRFDVTRNLSGGTLSQVSAVTDLNGRAVVPYVVGNTVTALGDTITATADSNGKIGTGTLLVNATSTAQVIGSAKIETGAASLVADGNSFMMVRALVLDIAGNPAAGITVNFSSSLGTLADSLGVAATSAVTNNQGIATLFLTSGLSIGTSLVAIEANGFIDQLSIPFVAGPPTLLTATLQPTTANPLASVRFQVYVEDANGNPVSGEQLQFANGVPNDSGGSFPTPTAVTNLNGIATATYSVGSLVAAGNDALRATVSRNGLSTAINLPINSTANAAVIDQVVVTVGSTTMVADASMTNLVKVRALVTDIAGDPVAGQAVNFATTLGDFWDPVAGASLATASTVTTSNLGIAEIFLRSSTSLGSARVTANAAGFFGEQNVQFVAGLPANIAIATTPTSINPGGTVGLLATVTDAGGNLVSNETIHFTVVANNSGGTLQAISTLTDVNGQARVSYVAGTTNNTTDTFRARAESNGLLSAAVATVTVSGAQMIDSIMLSSGSQRMVADGTSSTTVRAQVVDINGDPAPDNTPVLFTINNPALGTLTDIVAVNTVGGIAQTTLTSTTQLGLATITAVAGGFQSSVDIQMVAGSPTTVVLTSSPTSVAPFGTVTLSAKVTASDNGAFHPVVGELVYFTKPAGSNGTLAADSAVTNANGVATATVVTDNVINVASGLDSVTVTATSSTNQQATASSTFQVSASAALVGTVTLKAGAASLIVGGVPGSTTMFATVLDTQSRPLQNQTVNFSTSLGTIVASAKTNAQGIAEAVLTATSVGVAKVTAIAAGLSSQVSVTMTADAPATLTMSTGTSVAPGGQARVTAWVKDAGGLNVVGETVIFTVMQNNSGGALTTTQAVTNADGIATVFYNAGSNFTTTNIIDKVSARTSSNGIANTAGSEATINVTPNAQVIDTVTVTTGAPSLIADGLSTTVVRVSVVDIIGDPVVGRSVHLTTTKGFLLNSPLGNPPDITSTNNLVVDPVTNVNGVVEVFLLASSNNNVVAPAQPAPDGPGVAIISADVDGYGAISTVQFTSGAPAVITLSASPASVVLGGVTRIAAKVVDGNGQVITNEAVNFEILVNQSGSSLSTLTATTDVNGYAYVDLQSGLTVGSDQIVARAVRDLAVQSAPLTVDVTLPTPPTTLVVSASQYNINSDNSDVAVITATALDGNGAVIEGIEVNFKATNFSQLSTARAVTDANGRATASVSSGTSNRNNRTVSVVVSIQGLTPLPEHTVTLYVVGSTVDVKIGTNTLVLGGAAGADTTTVTVLANDAGGSYVPNAPITLTLFPDAASVNGPGAGQFSNGKTTISGVIDPVLGSFTTTLTATAAGDVYLVATGLGMTTPVPATAPNSVSISLAINAFKITSPVKTPVPGITVGGAGQVVTVSVPSKTAVTFSTSIGTWLESGTSTYTTAAGATTQSATLVSAADSGTATVQVDTVDATGALKTDTMAINIAADCLDAAQVILQATNTTLPISTATQSNTTDLTARVNTSFASGQQPVAGCKVQFSITQAAGGGESLAPVMGTSNAKGIVTTTFTAGTIGSPSQGVVVTASVLDADAKPHPNRSLPAAYLLDDSINIVITDQAGSVEIGHAPVIEEYDPSTYSLPMSVIVTNAAGQAVPGAKVNLSVWPEYFNTGIWQRFVTSTGIIYCLNRKTGSFKNEDDWFPGDGRYRNLTLDAEEDTAIVESILGTTGVDLNYDGIKDSLTGELVVPDVADVYIADGMLTPHNSAGGAVPALVTTDANGVAEFRLNYLKQFSGWILNNVIATTEVEGTEVRSVLRFDLPALKKEAEDCLLNDSPFNPLDQILPPGYVNPTAVASVSPTTASAAASAAASQTVTLDGTASIPGTSGTISTYYWEQIGGIPGDVTISGLSSAIATFTAPTWVSSDPVLRFRLRVTDDMGAIGYAEVMFTVTP